MKTIKNLVQNLDRYLAGSGNSRRQFFPILYWKKELEMLSRLLKVWNERCQDHY